jgi:PadR family transcriptional regulator AphA
VGQHLLLGEWACLGILYSGPAHGFAIAGRLRPEGDVGRVWSVSRPLTYRSIEQLVARSYIRPVGEEPGIAGGTRTILAATRTGRAELRRWVRTPVVHVREVRSALLLKLVIADLCGLEIGGMLHQQRAHFAELEAALASLVDSTSPTDVVALWRHESSQAALRFLDRLAASFPGPGPA